MKTVDLKIEGMADGGAAQSLIVALTAIPGVAKADVSLMKKRARITYDPAKTGIEAFRSAILRAGYRAS
jgi:copper chaperone CopZ